MSLTLEMLPAREGDCLLVGYDDGGKRRYVLVDGGRAGSYTSVKERLGEIPVAERKLELLVITHIDRDHIEGVLSLLEDPGCPVTFRDIWFNGYHHLDDDESYGGVMGERLTEALSKPGRPWNMAFDGKAVRLPDEGLGDPIELRGGLRLTVLSPDARSLRALKPVWERECEKAGIVPTATPPQHEETEEESFGALNVVMLANERFEADTTKPNGSSIALLAECEGRRILLAADAHVEVLLDALDRLQPGGERVKLDALKVSHHGSARNLSREFLDRIDCPRYLISTSGAYFKHPARAAIARVVVYGGDAKEIFFNYRSKYTDVWEDLTLQRAHGYTPWYGTKGVVRIEL